ncbi:hypothetical protein LRP52_10440 [Photobacterium sp. ZSDE20]|uniref:Uncharacterized protein n=1 Tax=Photobacterium pectinilyticum TaxID=2906793 RepID=A0ABT1N007_9GAMM|nr:hypothetical protein [Photobacterium sp. ZSDE20]MCQ1058078.1 hypothetical protein [Photobacterium sp. ZSDE20]MDD1822611.1 hypothetical protein [Photobacterium sp. ZSDE20]
MPVSSVTAGLQHNVYSGVDSAFTRYMPMLFSQQLAQSASFDRFFATASQNLHLQASQTELNALFKLDQTDFVDAIDVHSSSQSNNNQHSKHDRSLDLAIVSSNRFASLLRHDPEEVEPAYQLAIELPIEPVPSFAKDYRVDMQPALDWALNTSPPSGRISGWKESNLLYTVYHHRLS